MAIIQKSMNNKHIDKIVGKAWHVTTAIHNSRYSQRMTDNHVKLDKPIWLSEKDELVITESIARIVKEDMLNVLEYNICRDHMHILLVCEKEKLSTIVGKLKAVSGRACNIERGITIPSRTDEDKIDTTETTEIESTTEIEGIERDGRIGETTRGRVPLSDTDPDPDTIPIPSRNTLPKKKKKYNSLWTQKFGRRKITDENDLRNVIAYIKNNRKKHKLPANERIRSLAEEMCRVV
ncbi:MAG: transposase [Bacteroidales bacterium]|nr:transposase [Bacteroidales bacterium]